MAFTHPPEGDILFHRSGRPEAEQLNERVRLNVESSAGKDLDRVKLYFFDENISPEDAVFDDTSYSMGVVYGGLPPGLPDNDPLPSYIKTNGEVNRGSFTQTGVSPIGGMGNDDFYLIGFNTRAKRAGPGDALISAEAKFPDGEYAMVARAHSIRHDNTDVFFDAETFVRLDNFRPYVESVEIKDSNGETKYLRRWTLNNGILVSPEPEVDEPLVFGRYDITATFSEYMERAAMSVNLLPAMMLEQYDNYELRKTTFSGRVDILSADFPRDELRPFIILGMDTGGNETLKLDAGKRAGDGRGGFERAIDPMYELVRGDDGPMRGTGGEDRFHSLRIDAAPPEISWKGRQGYFVGSCIGGTPERCGSEAAPYNINFNTVTFRYTDLGSGLKELKIYKEKLFGEVIGGSGGPPLSGRSYADERELELPDGRYVQTITDNLGRTTTMYFRIDPVTPRLEVSSITMAADFTTYSVYGVVVDTGSGMDYLRLSRINTPDAAFGLVSGTTESVNYSFPGLTVGGDGYYAFTAQDKAQNISWPAPIMQFDRTPQGNVAPGWYRAVVHYVTEVTAAGDPCAISVTSSRNTFEIPVNYEIGAGAITAALPMATTTMVTVASPDKYIHGDIKISVTQKCYIENGVTTCVDACYVGFKGSTVFALFLGPAVAVGRYSDSPARFNLTIKPFMADFTFENAAWDAGSPPAINFAEAPPPPAPWGYVNYPPDSPRGWQLETSGLRYDKLTIKAYGLPDFMSDGERSLIKLWKYHNGVPSDITTGFDGSSIKGVTYDTSLFTLVAPLGMFDKQGPVTSLSIPQAGMYISTSTALRLGAVDVSSNSYALAGVATTYYLLDTEATPECLTTQYDPSAPKGTCANSVYTGPFTLSEGPHIVHALSVDKLGNYGGSISSGVYVDGTAPEMNIAVGGAVLAAGATAYITAADSITITAQDPVSGGVASGVAATYMLINISPEECEYAEGIGGINGMGSCENTAYTGPFTLPDGAHTVYYSAMDNVGNEAEVKSAFFTVSSIQAALPVHPSSGPIGMPFTIEGAGFGSYSAGATVVLIGGTTTPLTLWTDGKIQGTIPGTLAAGQHPVVVKRGAAVLAEVSPFTVTLPALYTLNPSSGAIGLPFTLTGESFGNYVANYTRVLLGGTTMPLTLWTDTKIQGTIPGILPVGDYELVVERALNGGVVRTSTAAFSLINMQAYWLAPSSGPIGMPFTITGAGFGNYSAAYTHVLLGDTTAPLTLWTDTRIQGTVSGGLIPGQYPVVVQRRTSDGGLMQTAAMQFEVVNVDVASMTPVAGPIGLPFTIYGSNFGNYVANYTKVLIGGTTTPLTLWTDGKIQGTIPGTLAAGTYPVIIERELNGGLMQSSALAFTVSTPTAYSLSPSSGPIGVPFTINGVNFGNYSAAYTGVLINGATVPLTLWTDIKIQGTIPGNLALGQYPVVVSRRTSDGGAVQTAALTFEVAGVNVSSITPIAGPIGMPFTIYGNNFGNYSANYTKVLIGGAAAPLTLWTNTKIQGTIPGSLIAGGYPVIVERNLNGGQVQSSSLTWTLTMPSMAAVSPSSGPIGLPFTITGTSFGNYAANHTKVLIGGATAPLTLWTDTQIKGTIPGALAAGAYELYVERAINGGVVRTSTFSFMVGTPYLAAVSPSTAAVIAPFTLTGYNFGNYVANYTKVLVNGATTTLTLWTDTKIQGKLPFLLTGQYPVQVQRFLNGGLAESSTAWINIVEPVISSMSPISGAAGTVFNLYGAGFGPYDASQTRVTIGGAACALSLWTDTRITGAVPSTLSYGTHTVVASRGQALSNALEFYIPGGYSPSMLKTGAIPSALEFRLGEVYVYPDPAKGSKVPVFHIEVGTADSVKIKVFTVAGQLVHERTLTGNPQATGQTYAYEYAWIGRITSGVYYYTIEAERSGKKIKTKGRFSVVR